MKKYLNLPVVLALLFIAIAMKSFANYCQEAKEAEEAKIWHKQVMLAMIASGK